MIGGSTVLGCWSRWWLAGCLVVLSGCVGLPVRGDAVPAQSGTAARFSASRLLATGAPSTLVPDQLFSRDPVQLNQQLTPLCRQPVAAEALRPLVAALSFSQVDPGTATAALLAVGCGKDTAIVEAVLARAGPQAEAVVMQRALRAGGTARRQPIKAAANRGLAAYQVRLAASDPGESTELPTHGMLYLPSLGQDRQLVTAFALNLLFDEAVPGYGIYSFVLPGRAAVGDAPDEPRGDNALFRMIDTYVANSDDPNGAPSLHAHVFLVPIVPSRLADPLAEQIAVDLSRHVRARLFKALREHGYTRLARRLEQAPGPLIVSALEPHLLPSHRDAPRLIADLSALGPEAIYDLVDAYDRPVGSGAQARRESLLAIRERLARLRLLESSASWLHLTGQLVNPVARSR